MEKASPCLSLCLIGLLFDIPASARSCREMYDFVSKVQVLQCCCLSLDQEDQHNSVLLWSDSLCFTQYGSKQVGASYHPTETAGWESVFEASCCCHRWRRALGGLWSHFWAGTCWSTDGCCREEAIEREHRAGCPCVDSSCNGVFSIITVWGQDFA